MTDIKPVIARIKVRLAEIDAHVVKYPSWVDNSTWQHGEDLKVIIGLLEAAQLLERGSWKPDDTGRCNPPRSDAELTHEDATEHPEEVLYALRNFPRGDRITIWRDGSWKRWPAMDAIQARKEDDWLSEIPTEELKARAILALSPDPAFLGEVEEASSPTRAASPASGLTATAPHSQSEKER